MYTQDTKYLFILAGKILRSFCGKSNNKAFKLKSRLICFISIAPLPACKISVKLFDNWLYVSY